MNFGSAHLLLEKCHHRIEVLDVPDLDQTGVLAGGGHDLFGLLHRGAERFFNQKVAALGEQRHGHLRVQVRRHDHRDGLAGGP